MHVGRKLSVAQVVAIRTRYAAGGISQLELAEEHDVSQRVIGLAIRRKTYRDIPMTEKENGTDQAGGDAAAQPGAGDGSGVRQPEHGATLPLRELPTLIARLKTVHRQRTELVLQALELLLHRYPIPPADDAEFRAFIARIRGELQ